jgi:hypothetical protein
VSVSFQISYSFSNTQRKMQGTNRGTLQRPEVKLTSTYFNVTQLALFIGAMGVMENRNAQQIREKFSDMYKPALITNWQVWPIAQLVNFRFMPLPYRIPFQSTCGVFWTLYLSMINSRCVTTCLDSRVRADRNTGKILNKTRNNSYEKLWIQSKHFVPFKLG